MKSADRPRLARAPGADRVSFGTATNLCEVPPKDRVDCGYPEITSEQCVNRGCCFDSSIHGVPWCFKPLQDTGKRPQGGAPRSPGSHARPGGTPSAAACPAVEASVRGVVPRAVGGPWQSQMSLC